jgi:hypothetical protein
MSPIAAGAPFWSAIARILPRIIGVDAAEKKRLT